MKRSEWNGVRQEFWWLVHNMVAHPIGQVLYMLGWLIPGLQEVDGWLHDWTVPKHEKGTGHG